MQLVSIYGDADLSIHNISIIPSDQCATEEQRNAKCCCGDDFFYDFPQQKCLVSGNVGFMFGRLNNSWSHVVIYGFVYPMLVLTLIAPLSAVMLGMGKREKREGDRRYPNPLYQLISLLCFCAWISLLAPLPFTAWYYIIGDGLRQVNQSVVMCHIFRTSMEVVPHTVDTMASLFSVLLAAARFLTQHARSALKLRTVERFSRAIWSIIFISCLLGTLRFFEHDTTTYTFCIDTEPAVTWAQRCMVRDGPLIAFLGLGRPFWKAFLPLADLFVQFIIPATLLVLLHIGFNRDPIINTGADKHNRFGRSMRDQTRIVIYAITVSFLVVQLPTTCVTLLSLTATHFAAIHAFAVIALLIGHLQPLFAVASILANSGGLLAAYYVIVKDDDLDVDHDSNSSMEDGDAENYLLQRGRGRHGTYRGSNYLSTSMSFDTSSMRTYSRRGSDYPVEHVFLVNTPQTSPVQQMNQQIPQQLSPIPFQEYQRKGSQQRKGSGQRKESQQRRTSSPSQRRQSAGTSSSKRSSPSPVPPSFLVGFSSKC